MVAHSSRVDFPAPRYPVRIVRGTLRLSYASTFAADLDDPAEAEVSPSLVNEPVRPSGGDASSMSISLRRDESAGLQVLAAGHQDGVAEKEAGLTRVPRLLGPYCFVRLSVAGERSRWESKRMERSQDT